MGFFNDDILNPTVLQSNRWYHGAFVYDNNICQQTIYINGLLNKQSATSRVSYL